MIELVEENRSMMKVMATTAYLPTFLLLLLFQVSENSNFNSDFLDVLNPEVKANKHKEWDVMFNLKVKR